MRRLLTLLTILCGTAAVSAQTKGPDSYSARIALGAESYTWQSTPQTQNASQAPPAPAGFRAATPLHSFAPRSAARNGVAEAGRRSQGIKPFNHVVHSPTLSPYLNLYREEQEGAVPNYHTFVRPAQEQQQANDRQVQQLQQLQRQVRQASYTAPGAQPAPQQRSAARYGDTAHFYSGWAR